ncbi:hypothetical protein D0962_28110 [Leptolyngbyaceae cyanobacterium CCMR0082]|uniref:Glycosyltransferase RgtA/B/C/D-like domain-containing protein n=1 Tax=Adonisia turfae CCMR0082 TaxID=2304604 RepID=A0A6M0SEZ5_9CYAN|nr:hypothetical protein [Adonisia turfae]NEZ66581.1 hypothetical protein [Adonisia turfae CCMR0082]
MTLRLPRQLVSLYKSPWTAVIIIAVLGLIGTLNHSMWRDEMNVWLIARDSPSWGAFVENIRYDRAHPGLWHLLVAMLYHLFGHPVSMQVFHWLLAMGSVLLIWRCSPFTQWQKWLFTFGYLPFYEHLLIARNYAVAMLLLFAICALWPQRQRAYWPLAGLLVLLANTNVYAFLIAIALALTLGLELVFDAKLRRNWLDILFSGGLIIAGYAMALHFILPPSYVANQALEGYVTGLDIRHLLRAIGRIFGGYYVIIPNGRQYLDLLVCGVLALGSCWLVCLKLVKKPYPLAFYLLGNGIILGFTYAKFMPNSIRHFGNFYLILIAALWLAHYYPPTTAITQYLPSLEKQQQTSKRWFNRMFATVLTAQLLGGIFMFVMDFTIPYSASRAAAAYMRQANLQDEFIVASRDAQMASLSGYFGRSFYFPERQAIGSYTLFFKGVRNEVDHPEVIRQVKQLILEHPKILLVLTKKLEEPTPGLTVEPIEQFTKAWQNEEYYLYWVTSANN